MDVMHAQRWNFWTNRFGWARWARHINDYENAHCTRTLSSPCYMRFIWHNGRRHSFLIYELLWDNTRRALMHTPLMFAAPEFVNYRDWNKQLFVYIFHRPWFEKKLYMHAWKFRYCLTRVSWIYINATSEFSVCMYVCLRQLSVYVCMSQILALKFAYEKALNQLKTVWSWFGQKMLVFFWK